MRTVTDDERRARLGRRHLLATPARSVEAAANALVGLHASDPATPFLSAMARVGGFTPSDLEAALYEERSLVRMLGMRRTLFVVPRDLAAVVESSCTQALGAPERRRLIGWIEAQGIAEDGQAWVGDVCARTLAALEARGEATAVELSADVPELTAKLTFGEGKTWGGQVGISTRILFLLAAEGSIVRGRPRGSWISSQYRWAPTDRWLGAPLERLPHATASGELLARWLRAFGPATRADIRWWTGWTERQTALALDVIAVEQVALDDDAEGYLLADDLRPVRAPAPWVALLPGLDPTTMGWKQRRWYLGDHADALFDRNGNAGPTVWAGGRVIGGWAQRPDGTVAVELLETVDAATATRVAERQQALERWFGEVRLTPRFRTPLERSLLATAP
jgi:hypothetical protein